MDIYVVFMVFAFAQGPDMSSNPIYVGENKEYCEQTANDYNEFYKELDYRKAVCLRIGTAYNPQIDNDETIFLRRADSLIDNIPSGS